MMDVDSVINISYDIIEFVAERETLLKGILKSTEFQKESKYLSRTYTDFVEKYSR